MTNPSSYEDRPAYALIDDLARPVDEDTLRRTLLVAPTRGQGREILRALARRNGRWIGLEVTTLRPLALEIAGAGLAERGSRLLDEFEEQAIVEEVLDRTVASMNPDSRLRDLAEGVGFRRAARGAVRALRLASVSSGRLGATAFGDASRRDLLVGLLRGFERRLGDERAVDTADVLRAAIRALADGSASLDARVLLVPGLGTRGLAGRFIAELERRGAKRLAADPVVGLAPPRGALWHASPTAAPLSRIYDPGSEPVATLSMFRAAGVTEELREVLRRVLASNLRWDQVEIVTPDPITYGPALHSLARRLEIPTTFAVGLPVERTRAGRAVSAWLRWVTDDFPEWVLRALLARGDIQARGRHARVSGPRLAARLRTLRVGWGRDRYLARAGQALRHARAALQRASEREEPEWRLQSLQREQRELEALSALLKPLVRAAPTLGPRLDPSPGSVSPADLARGLQAMLRFVRPGGAVEETALERLGAVVERIAESLTRATDLRSALAQLEEHLEIRIPAPRAEGKAPWGSAGGHLHLSDVRHGGFTGRTATFVVGMDATRFPGSGHQDPILLDRDRTEIAGEHLPTSVDRIRDEEFQLAALLARTRGGVTLSWAAWEASEGRVAMPSPVLLRAYRSMTGDPDVGYADLEAHVGDPVSRVPRGGPALDADDAWLSALSHEGRLLQGERLVRRAFPALDAGLAAAAARLGAPGAHHGLVEPRPSLDPREAPDRPLSASALEALGTCPLRYFYAYVLRARPPDDPRFDPERWLDALQRGALLHRVYERLLREAREGDMDLGEEALADRAALVAEEEAVRTREEIPAPSEAVFRRERSLLALEARSFAGMLRQDPPTWVATELRFGFGPDSPEVVILELPSGGELRLRGAIDRVDRLPSGALRVVDYKTGASARFSGDGVWAGGRRLQHFVYAHAAERLLGQPVERMEYQFPTLRGQNDRVVFPAHLLARGPELVEALIGVVSEGRFLPTDESSDCTYCDFRTICRVSSSPWGSVDSPLASWAAERSDVPEFDSLRTVRRFEEGS